MIENYISSVQNAKVKMLVALHQKSAERRKLGLFVVEGQRELQRCIDAGLQIDSVFWTKASTAAFQEKTVEEMVAELDSTVACYEVTDKVYEKIAYRGGTEGIVATVKCRSMKLSDLNLPDDALVVVLESVEKPGNLGAILRSADASGVDAVIVCDPLTDLFNPNLIRSSVGAAFSVPTAACSSEECIAMLKAKGIQILTAQLQDSQLYYDTDMRRATAIVMGTESTGLTDQWRKAADAHIRIPMLGSVDSLNVSVSAAVLMYEARRQRNAPLPTSPIGEE